MDRQHLSVDLEFGDSLSCDSAASNMAANNDLDRRMADDEDDDFSDLEVPDLPKKRDSQFKIVVSAPGTMDVMDSRVTAKRAQSRRFCGSDMDCDTDDCGSSESESESMIFSDNDSRMGIFASFPGADVESEYLSAQSDDFDDLAICFRRDRRDRNIRFRRQNAPKYLNVGQSDMGSDDTECFSSDSITDMMPPTVSPIQFVPMVARWECVVVGGWVTYRVHPNDVTWLSGRGSSYFYVSLYTQICAALTLFSLCFLFYDLLFIAFLGVTDS